MTELAFVATQTFEAKKSKAWSIDHPCNHHFLYPPLKRVLFFRLAYPASEFVSFPLFSRFVEQAADHRRFCRSERSHMIHPRLNALIA